MVRSPPVFAPMWHFSGASTQITTSLGYTGADSRTVLAAVGIDDAQFDVLLASGVVHVSDGT